MNSLLDLLKRIPAAVLRQLLRAKEDAPEENGGVERSRGRLEHEPSLPTLEPTPDDEELNALLETIDQEDRSTRTKNSFALAGEDSLSDDQQEARSQDTRDAREGTSASPLEQLIDGELGHLDEDHFCAPEGELSFDDPLADTGAEDSSDQQSGEGASDTSSEQGAGAANAPGGDADAGGASSSESSGSGDAGGGSDAE